MSSTSFQNELEAGGSGPGHLHGLSRACSLCSGHLPNVGWANSKPITEGDKDQPSLTVGPDTE